MASETLGQSLSYINELLPNRINSTTIITLINSELRKSWHQMTSTQLYDFNTVSSQVYYSLPTDCDFDMINENGLFVANTTGSTSYETYSYAGADEDLTGNKYFQGIGGTFGLYPTPDNVYSARIKYQERPVQFASSDTSVQYNIDQDYVDLIKFRVMSRVAKAGNSPDTELANGYELDANELERKLKMKTANMKMKNPRIRFSYKLDWDK